MGFKVFEENEGHIKAYTEMLTKVIEDSSGQMTGLNESYSEKAKLIIAHLSELVETKAGDSASFAINHQGEKFQGIVSYKGNRSKDDLEADIDTLFNFLGQVSQEIFLRTSMPQKKPTADILNYYYYSPKKTPDETILSLYLTGKLPMLVYAESVNQSKDSVASKIADMELKVDQWQKKLDSLADTENKVNELSADLERKRLSFGFLGLAAAFKEFHKRKNWPLYTNLAMCIIFGLLLLITPLFSYFQLSKDGSNPETLLASVGKIESEITKGSKFDLKAINVNIADIKKKLSTENESGVSKFKKKWYLFIPLLTIEILLLYYFRIFLQNFNNTKSQIMQLETRNSVCQFIEPYFKFKTDNKELNTSLEKFEALMFSNLAPNDEKIPSTFDGLEQLAKLIKSIK